MFSKLAQRGTFRSLEERIEALPIVKRLALKIRIKGWGESEVSLQNVSDFHLGGVEGAYLNGGVLHSMFDAALASAGLSVLGGRRCATVKLTTHLRRAVPPTGATCRCVVLRQRGRLVYLSACLVGKNQKTLATARGVVARV